MNNELQIKEKTTLEVLREKTQSDYVRKSFNDVLGKKANGFVSSLLSIVSNNELLAKAEPKSILNAAMIAATLDLQINPNLGFAYIIPYNKKISKKGEPAKYITAAQFQIGYKGFVQLAQRSGQFETLNVSRVCEGEIESNDLLTGEIKFSWNQGDRDKLPTVGYVAYMRLLNGFSKSLYMTVQQLKNHGLRYSQTAKKGYGLWNDNFDAMASKTVVKLLLSKYAPLTTEMATAQLSDQAIIGDNNEYEYIDNNIVSAEEISNEKEIERIKKFMDNAKSLDELEKCKKAAWANGLDEMYDSYYDTLADAPKIS